MAKLNFAALLTIALLVFSITSVTSASPSSDDVGASEKEIIDQVPQDSDPSGKRAEKARKIRERIDKLMDEQIEESVKSLPGKNFDVYLGEDATITYAATGDYGTAYWGGVMALYGSDYILTENKARAATVCGPFGVGGAGAWAWVGKSFYVWGSGSQKATIWMEGHLLGLTSAVLGSAYSKVSLVLYDRTADVRYTAVIYEKLADGAGWFTVDKDFGYGISGVSLQGGHMYTVYLEVRTSAAIYGMGEAGSDFGPQDLDYAGEGVWWYFVTIDFW